ncbi:MAG: riboflavin synthase [Pseudomonadota bacterium]
MFTGLIETIGTVTTSDRLDGDIRIVIDAPDYASESIEIGESIAINGVCLTVVAESQGKMSFDVSVESLNHSLIGDWQPGVKVNLERALLANSRLGGHMVSGHVDGIAELIELVEDARSWRMVFRVPDTLKKYVVHKGSVTLNGTSLTVNSVDNDVFDINVIPHTFEVTTFGGLSVGDRVHIEVDLIARYLERLIENG